MAWQHGQFTRFTAANNPVPLAPLGGAPATVTEKQTPPDSLFGPNIGPIEPGPAWTTQGQPKRIVEPDELTTDTVRAWIEKSKIPNTATTTLQALVNLRRPTLRLSPLTPTPGVSMKDAPHLVEFVFDCAAAQCGVHVQVHLPPNHPDAPAHGGSLSVFDAVVAGGFGRALGPADSAVIELARFERVPLAAEASAAPAAASTVPASTGTPAPAPERKRFTPFQFRRNRSNTASSSSPVAGAALTIVDTDKKAEGEADDADEKGVHVTIRLVALDAEGRELDAPNEHTVYLSVSRLGAPALESVENKDADGEKDADPRPWVVRVVKREATIGPHTFHLHEIYGLSSAAAPAPVAPSYPPQPTAEEPPERECLLCLSAPREVVLLPCRHLVACRPCAVNMIEFGAGGAIAPAEEPSEPAAATGAAPAPPTDAEAAVEGVVTPPAVTTTVPPRRKRKAKGWFCPVCRQPYTSLLRITTAPPPADGGVPISPTTPAPVPVTSAEDGGTGGGILSGLRPAFLRGLSLRGPGAVPRDVEAQA
ncbi:unnamed protein product [Mycena citricolor]|uniref:RING-type domain-containing protein n=1 Tax=Mycena citricolor TaxID=2018698 RepID=A0AAD2JU36_9AGAR|nr:unnamed protein product [Mycena citricolor]